METSLHLGEKFTLLLPAQSVKGSPMSPSWVVFSAARMSLTINRWPWLKALKTWGPPKTLRSLKWSSSARWEVQILCSSSWVKVVTHSARTERFLHFLPTAHHHCGNLNVWNEGGAGELEYIALFWLVIVCASNFLATTSEMMAATKPTFNLLKFQWTSQFIPSWAKHGEGIRP